MSPLSKVILYTKEICPLCDEALSLLKLLQFEYDFTIEERDIYTNDKWLEKYCMSIPVLSIHGQEVAGDQIHYEKLAKMMREYMAEM